MVDPEVAALLVLVYEHQQELIAQEDQAAGQVAKQPNAQLDAALAWLGATWLNKAGSLTTPVSAALIPEITNELARRIGKLALDKTKALNEAANRALALGLRQGYQEIRGVPDGSRRIRSVLLAADVRLALAGAQRRALAQTQAARTLVLGAQARPELTYTDAAAVVATARRAVTSNEATARWVVNRANNQGIDTVAAQFEADTIWIAERDACVICIALSGRICAYGAPFPAELTFGDRKPSRPWPSGVLWYPPRHPSCRCSTRPVLGYSDEQELQFSDALKREARRSIVRGFSLPSESEGVRIRAADRLLRQGAGLPKTVEQYGRLAVRAGRFPSRSVPTGRR